MEIDPGKDGETTVKLISSVKPEGSNVTITSEFETKIKKNNPDDEIMEQVIPRTAMFTVQTKIDDNHYQKSFSESGVTVNVKITGIDGLEF